MKRPFPQRGSPPVARTNRATTENPTGCPAVAAPADPARSHPRPASAVSAAPNPAEVASQAKRRRTGHLLFAWGFRLDQQN